MYEGYLINWTLAHTLPVLEFIWAITFMYAVVHFVPLFNLLSILQLKKFLYSGLYVEALIVWLLVSYFMFAGVNFFGVMYLIIIDMIFYFVVLWIWTKMPQQLLGLLQESLFSLLLRCILLQVDKDRKPLYCIDATQKHYPRKRYPNPGVQIVFTSKNHFPRLKSWLDHHKDVDIGIPDVEEEPGNHCICSFVMKLHPPDPIHSFIVYFCKCREDDAFYELCSAFDVPENVRVLIATNNSSITIRCLDALHRVYHRDNELTLAMIKTKLSEYSDELKQVISDYHEN